MLIGLSGCAGNSFSIEFSLPDDLSVNYTVSYYASDRRGGMMIETVAPVTNGKAVIQGTTVNPALVFLSAGKHSIAIYVRRGETIRISGNDGNPFSWSMKGDDITEKLAEWRNGNATELQKGDPETTNRLIAKYVIGNPDSPVSTLLLLTSFSRTDDESLFRSLWLRLKDEARDPEWTALAGRADQPDTYVKTPARLRSMVVRSFHNGVDTIRPESAKASILFFWNSGHPSRREHFDSIKALAKEFPDSATRIIADICVEADSIAWRSPLKSDSLRGVIRGWLPAGLADQRLIDLSVSRTPYYIVTSPDGIQRYRGMETKDAFEKFRKLMKGRTP